MERYFDNPYDAAAITDERFINFLEDHFQRVKAQNEAGRHDALLARLETAIATLRANQSVGDVARVRRIGKTRSLDALVALFKADVRQHEGTVKGLFKKDSETYIEFFPEGLDEYDNITRTTTPTLIKRWETLTTDHAGNLPPVVVTLFGAYGTQYKTLRGQQQEQQGNVERAATEGEDARTAAELVAVGGMHHIGGLFPGEAARCAGYYNRSLLFPQGPDNAPAPTPGP